MVEVPSIEGLLHLGTLAVVLCAGYLGIDRIRSERQTLISELEEVQKYVRTKIDALNLPLDEHVELPMPYRSHAMYVLCYVARIKLAKISREARFKSFFCKIYYVPMLPYFRSGYDRYVIALLCFVSMLLFEMLIFAGIEHEAWIRETTLLRPIFWIFTVIVVWVFVTAAVAGFRLRNLGEVCMKLKAQVIKQFEEIMSVDLMKSRAALEDVKGASEPAAEKPRPTVFRVDD
jgi:hypothetical protein